ncbi:MAG TPA: hypothetical protein VG941_02695 [Candidatus Paceibacterota bacterium]|nr:hypothetical protein [Candidatus Paceibacterota bacterium]
MEKVFIKPVAKEILLKANGKEGSSDSFLYDYDSDPAKRVLGNLYVVGNVQMGVAEPDAEDLDVAYVINLIASLAKREYYAKPELAPKEAFTNTLKKINGVVEEFFKKQDTKINVGIFAIAGDQLHISKLGKFKILLARDGRDIDILNNVDLFDREATQEKEFSNIISGKVSENDRILAFYPSRSVTARTKSFKDSFLKLGQDDFVATLAALKEEKPDFACAAVHVDLQKCMEAAVQPRVQPRELRDTEPEVDAALPAPQPVLASHTEEKPVKPRVTKKKEPIIPIILDEPAAARIAAAEPVSAPAPAVEISEPRPVLRSEIPKIIPSEFGVGRKTSAFSKYARRLARINMTPRGRAIALGGAAVLVVGTVFGLKSFVFISAADRQANAAVLQAQENIKLASDKAGQNDLAGARSVLIASLSDITATEQEQTGTTRFNDIKQKIRDALDSLEGAVDANLSVAAEIPDDAGRASLITVDGDQLYAYLNQDSGGAIALVSASGVDKQTAVTGMNPSQLFGSGAYVVAVDPATKKIASLSTAKSTIGLTTYAGDPFTTLDFFQNNIYAVSGSQIVKMTDAATGHTKIDPWLQSGTAVRSDANRIAIDGNVYVLSQDGTLTTYYKGKVSKELNTGITNDSNSLLLTTDDGSVLYIVNKQMGRIYVIAKETGALQKTYKLNTQKAIDDAAIADNGQVYVLSENKIWKVQ